MEKAYEKSPKPFSGRKVSVNQAINLLRRNGIRVSEEEASIILDFLYLSAGSFKEKEDIKDTSEMKVNEISNHL